MTKIRKSVVASIMLAAILMTVGCSSPHNRMGHTEDGKKTTYSSEQVLPEDFPDDIPFPSDYIVTGSITTEMGHTVTFESTEPFEVVANLYRDYTEQAGYEESYLMDEADFYNYTGAKGDENFVSTLTLDLEDNKTVTGIIVYGKGR
ncbi:hypothetical protein [Paenibacillus daejeonensis]|uniref:hypothetical protein n=1 Tax=Paenibacillus daejeonensis TaxID=135193 RepID=UPI00035FCEFC|nr:hypothetical protein [Paenibacillus daejeonensis]